MVKRKKKKKRLNDLCYNCNSALAIRKYLFSKKGCFSSRADFSSGLSGKVTCIMKQN